MPSVQPLFWGGWALRRLEPYIAGDVTALVRDLEGEIFYRGDLSRRLIVREPAAPPRRGPDATRSSSCATDFRRHIRGREDGIEAVQPDDGARWPLGYVEGLVAGLFFDLNGYLDLSGWKVGESARLMPDCRNPWRFSAGWLRRQQPPALPMAWLAMKTSGERLSRRLERPTLRVNLGSCGCELHDPCVPLKPATSTDAARGRPSGGPQLDPDDGVDVVQDPD